MTAIHHLHQRERIYQKHEVYPAKSRWKRILDKLVYVAGIMGPVMTLPQIFKIFLNKNATGLSIITWGLIFLEVLFC